jgi:hypothetical protein
VLPTGRLFGRISQNAPKKKLSGWTMLRPIYCIFHTHTDENSVFLKPTFIPKGKLLETNFFSLGGRIFLLDWPKSWQHYLVSQRQHGGCKSGNVSTV